MNTTYNPQEPSAVLINEIKYYMAFSALKNFFERTYHQRKLRQSQCCYCRKVRCFRILYLVVVVIALSSFLW